MILALVAGVACIATGTLMYTQKMRIFPFYRPIAFLFLFEGIWVLLDYIFRQIWPDNVFMQAIHCVGLAALGLYFVICGFFTGIRPGRKFVKHSIKKKKD